MAVFLGLVTAIVGILLFIERDKFEFSIDKQITKDILKFSLPMFPARLGGVANTYINRFFMMSMFSVEVIGLYSLSLKIASAIFLVQTAFTLAWNPYLYKILQSDGHQVIIRKVSLFSTILVCYVALLLGLFSNEIIKIIANPSYMGASLLVGYLALYNGLFLVKETVDIGVKVTKKSKFTSYLYFISLGVNIVCLFILPKLFDIEGVAMSLLLSNIILVFATLAVSKILYPMKFHSIFMACLIIGSSLFLFLFNRIEVDMVIKIAIFILLSSIFAFYAKDKVGNATRSVNPIQVTKISLHDSFESDKASDKDVFVIGATAPVLPEQLRNGYIFGGWFKTKAYSDEVTTVLIVCV